MRLRNFVLAIVTIILASLLVSSTGVTQEQEEKKEPTISLVPVRQEQLVYRWDGFDGKGWSGGFIPQSEDTIYFIANKNNAISAKKTLVYFWPITGKYMAGWKTLNEDVEGTLEILKDGKVIKKLEKVDNVLYYPEGYWGEINVLYTGKKAQKEHQRYKEAMDKYYEELKKYYEARQEYRKKLDEFFKKVKELREAGVKGPLNIEIPKEPKPPTPPDFYVTQPSKDYIVNLPVGEYQIRLRAKDGTIIEGSEKNLFVFTARRRGGVGYEIIPGNRWTKREECNKPENIIYAAGKNILYFRPYHQDEYNELYYNKLLDPQNEGREENWVWVHTRPIQDVFLLFFSEEKLLAKIIKKPYIVEQVPGPELGYNILEYTKEKFPYKKPTFEGYELTLTEKLPHKGYGIILEKKKEGTKMSGSKREIRLVKKENADLLYYLSFFPLVIWGIIFIGRLRKVKR